MTLQECERLYFSNVPIPTRLLSSRPDAPMQLPSPRGGCASSRLDQGFQIPSKTLKVQSLATTQETAKEGEAQALDMVPGPRNAEEHTQESVLPSLGHDPSPTKVLTWLCAEAADSWRAASWLRACSSWLACSSSNASDPFPTGIPASI